VIEDFTKHASLKSIRVQVKTNQSDKHGIKTNNHVVVNENNIVVN
jgi:hypothetical protein